MYYYANICYNWSDWISSDGIQAMYNVITKYNIKYGPRKHEYLDILRPKNDKMCFVMKS